jgi:hypothetical protein
MHGEDDRLAFGLYGEYQHLGNFVARITGDEVNRTRRLEKTVAGLQVLQRLILELELQLTREQIADEEAGMAMGS